jgi:hypothetical protein
MDADEDEEESFFDPRQSVRIRGNPRSILLFCLEWLLVMLDPSLRSG